MRDIQRERLKHLLTNAIVELWKKETGSLASVLIEGTICITSGTGKTVVLQVSDKFGSSIPEDDGCYRGSQTPGHLGYRYTGPLGMGSMSSPPLTEAPRVECHPHAMEAFLDNLSPVSLVSPVTDYSRSSRESRSPSVPHNNESRSPSVPHNGSRSPSVPHNNEQPMDTSNKEDGLSGGGWDKGRSPDSGPDRGTGGVIPGTGYYTCATPESEDTSCKSDSSPQSSALNLSSLSEPGNDSIKDDKRSPAYDTATSPADSMSDENHNDPNTRNAMDLTPRSKDNDLALSPPQSYTAQVRDVIRQKIMASKNLEAARDGDIDAKRLEELDRQSSLIMASGMVSPNHFHKVFAEHLPSPGMHMNGPLSPYTRQLTMPILSGRHMGINGPLESMMKNKSSSSMRQSPIPHDPTLSPLFHPSHTSPTMVPLRENSFMDVGKTEPPSPGVGDSPIEKDANGEQRVYRCEFCAKTFLFKSKYHEHLPVHTNARPFQCHLCSRTYKYKYDLRVHLRTHMGIPTKSTVCPFCTGKFDTNKVLRQHIKDAHRDKQKATEESCASPDNLPPAT